MKPSSETLPDHVEINSTPFRLLRGTVNGDGTQYPSKSLKNTSFEAKGRQYIAGKVIQLLFHIDPNIYLAIYRYR